MLAFLAKSPVLVFGLLLPSILFADDQDRQNLKFFEAKIRPLLANHCYKCHGAEKQKGDLRVDSIQALRLGGESGAAVVPGDAGKSLLIEAVRHESFEMPPDEKLKDDEIDSLVRWVKMGAPWPASDPSTAFVSKPKITDEDRSHWAFQPVRNVTPPKVDDDGWCRNEIDPFVLRRLIEGGLTPSKPADREALIRRVYFDLIGLPPSPKEIDDFLADRSMNAYAKLIDRLLESQAYGERWARHWLDLVRYAESDGYKQDAYRPYAWRYRDYVIRSFNDDKPYDQFIMEQLAGDEIAPNDSDAIVATGYLRNWIYEYNQRDVRTQWNTILDDITDVTGDVFLGMGMGCARCHDHKFDPILREDYYRLRAFFAPLLPREDVPIGTSKQVLAYKNQLHHWEEKTAHLRSEIEQIERPILDRAALPAINKFPPDIRPIMHKSAADRMPLESQLASMVNRQVQEEYNKLKIETKLKGEQKERWESLRKQLAQFDNLKPNPLPTALSVTDIGSAAPTTIIPGDRRRRDIAPGFLTVLAPGEATIPVPPATSNSTGRRSALARWIASPDNPLSTRVIVNRLWQHHFGRGLVSTASDFGNLGEPPTHPELLDYMVNRFIESDWSIKQLHRLIMNSATYQQTALRQATPIEKMKDPHNRLLWRMNVHRLNAEQIRDSMLKISGELDLANGGPSVDASSPRRAIYTKVKRNSRDPLLGAFDAPDNFSSTSERNVTTTPTQALLMINGSWGLARSRAFATQLQKMNFATDSEMVAYAYRSATGRHPTKSQISDALQFLAEQERLSNAGEEANFGVRIGNLSKEIQGVDLAPTGKANRLSVPFHESLPDGDFTIEAFVLLRSLYEDATVRTIAAQWDSNTQHPGWALGVTSKKSSYQPRNLILQLVGDPSKGAAGYEVIASNLRPELNKPYYVAVTVNLRFQSPAGITFYMKDLSQPDSELQTANVGHKVTEKYRGAFDFTIGGRDKSNRHYWDGLIGEVRLSSKALSENELLVKGGEKATGVVGHWPFDSKATALKDSSPNGLDLSLNNASQNNDSPSTIALIDFCHVLLNTNQILYVD
jgi:hypothetical protein